MALQSPVRGPQSATWNTLSHTRHVWSALLCVTSETHRSSFSSSITHVPIQEAKHLLFLSFPASSSFLSLLAPFQATLDHFPMAPHHSGYPIPFSSLYHVTLFHFLPNIYAVYIFLCLFIVCHVSCQFPYVLVSSVFPAPRDGPHSRRAWNTY